MITGSIYTCCIVVKYGTIALSTVLFQTQIDITLAEAQFSVYIFASKTIPALLCSTSDGGWPLACE